MPLLRPYLHLQPSEWLLSAERRSSIEEDPRESLRQWIARELIERYNYPRDWVGSRILSVGPSRHELCPDGFFGLFLTNKAGEPFLWASVAPPQQSTLAEQLLEAVLLSRRQAGLGIATDGSAQGTRFMRRRFDTDACEYVVDIEPYTPPQSAPGPKPYLFSPYQRSGRSASKQALTPLSERVENIFFEAHSHIRDIDGMHADEALDELCKLLHVKLYDEQQAIPSEPLRLQRWLYGSTEELASTVRSLYEHAHEHSAAGVSSHAPPSQSYTGVFHSPIRLSSPAIAKVVATLQDYDLTHSPVDLKGRAFQKVLTPAIRAGMGQYFTPEAVVNFMVEVANPTEQDLMLDPFCGSARFLTTSLGFMSENRAERTRLSAPQSAAGYLHGMEKSDRMVRIAMIDMALRGDGSTNIRCIDSLLAFGNYPDLQAETFDLILTNPPFGSLLGPEAVTQLGSFSLTDGRKGIPLELLGLERCIQFLRPGGHLGIVLPDGVLANPGTRYVREWLDHQVRVRAIISLPIETFYPFGASIKTSVLFATKLQSGEVHTSDYAVVLGRIDNVGYDASGHSRNGSDCAAMAQRVGEFLAKDGW